MARMARIVVPAIPHHVTQRGNRRQKTFFRNSDYYDYLELLKAWSGKSGLSIWGYCLMPNHVHLIVVPKTKESLAAGIGQVHRRYTRMINFREKWRGYLWQGRFASFPMDRYYLLAATKYILMNPVRAKLVKRPEDWRFSSLGAHLTGESGIIAVDGLGKYVKDWKEFLAESPEKSEMEAIRMHTKTGRPLGSESFIQRLENITGRIIRKLKPGPPGKKGVVES